MLRNGKNHKPREGRGNVLPHLSVGKEASSNSYFFPQSGQMQAPNVLMPSLIPSSQTMLPCQKTLIHFLGKNVAWSAKPVCSVVPINDHSPKNFPSYAGAPFPLPHLGFLWVGPRACGEAGVWLSVTPTLYWDTAWVETTWSNTGIYTTDPVRLQPTLLAQHAPWGTTPHML